jgi:hypothetical protein
VTASTVARATLQPNVDAMARRSWLQIRAKARRANETIPKAAEEYLRKTECMGGELLGTTMDHMEASKYGTTRESLIHWRKALTKEKYRSVLLCRLGKPYEHWRKQANGSSALQKCACGDSEGPLRPTMTLRHVITDCRLTAGWRERVRFYTNEVPLAEILLTPTFGRNSEEAKKFLKVLVILTDAIAKFMSYQLSHQDPTYSQMQTQLRVPHNPPHFLRWQTKLDRQQFVDIDCTVKEETKKEARITAYFRSGRCDCGDRGSIYLEETAEFLCIPCLHKRKKAIVKE